MSRDLFLHMKSSIRKNKILPIHLDPEKRAEKKDYMRKSSSRAYLLSTPALMP